jgi:4-amino-4-deoxy-L-arabinose transferase-like glycosyltransferase
MRIRFALLLAVAAALYFFQLGRAGFDDAEAYSAYIASRKTLPAVFAASLNLDPGKGGGLYVLLLHWYCAAFGTGEVALRAFSAAFALASVMLVYALSADLFGVDTALIAAALWAVNPIALIVARWARMYSMFIALALASLLAIRKVQRRPTAAAIAMVGILGAAMLYTHLGGALILAAEAALLVRDRWRGRSILPGAVGLAIAIILFAPIAPVSLAQVRASALGHRFDWIGSASQMPLALKLIESALAIAMGLILVLGPSMPFDYADADVLDDSEPLRWCGIWSILPLLALATGAVLLHPMFRIRYVAPVAAGFSILVAGGLRFAGTRIRNLTVVAIVSAFLVIAGLYQLYHPPFELWRRIARAVEVAQSPSQEVFFEAGYVMSVGQAAGLDPASLVEVLPDGYLRIPFDYYFAGPNPRRVVNPFRPKQARDSISNSARRDGGVWLVSHLGNKDLTAELPSSTGFECDRIVYDKSVSVSLYHIVPRDQPR